MKNPALHLVRTERRPSSLAVLLHRLWRAWLRTLARRAAHLTPDPGGPPPRSAAAALRDGAVLSERIDARARRSVA